jgi:hypothetical protein
VHDPVEVLEGVRVVEDDLGHRGPVEGAVLADDAGAEALDHGLVHGHARLLQLLDHGVGVEHHRALRLEQGVHRGLPRPDPTGEPEHQHGASR